MNQVKAKPGPVVEVCVESVESAVAAQQGGAHRVELCSDLLEGGLTPSYGTMKAAREALSIRIMAMIRPRGGDFCYSDAEYRVMREDIHVAKDLGMDGVVFGLLNPDGRIDAERTASLLRLARPLPVTFHRAFDMTRDAVEALDTLLGMGIDRVLTSGQEATVLEGIELIAKLMTRADGRIIVMPGGGITERNMGIVAANLPLREVHFGGGQPIEGQMRFRNPRVFMGGVLRPPEYTVDVLRPEFVSRMVTLAGCGQAKA